MADDREQRAADRAAAILQLDDVGDDLSVLAALERRRFGGAEASPRSPGSPSTALSHVSRVIGFGSSCSQPLLAKRPSRTDGSLRKEISRPARCALRIAACGLALRIAPDCTVTSLRGTRCSGTTPSCSQRRQVGDRRRLSTFQNSRTDVVRGALRPIAHRGQHFVRRLAAVERRDERLHDRDSAVVAARVAPRLQEVRLRNLPVAQRRRLVVVEAQVDAKLRPCSSASAKSRSAGAV